MSNRAAENAMPTIAQDAQRVSLLFHYGAMTACEVIAWADSWILELEEPSDLLIELSTTLPNETTEIVSRLHRLSTGADIWSALRSAFPRLHEFILSQPEKAEIVANHLFNTGCEYLSSNVPKDLNFIYRFDDAFSLAYAGIVGEPKAVYAEFIFELEKFHE
jgi:hypothetical protein